LKARSLNRVTAIILTVLLVINFMAINPAVQADDNPVQAEAPILTSAFTDAGGAQVVLAFNKAMADPTGKQAQFTVSNGADDRIDVQQSSGSSYFVQVSDLHLCNSADAQSALKSSPDYDPEVYAAKFVNEMVDLHPSFVVATGDLVALADKTKIEKGLEWFNIYNRDIAQPLSNAGITLYNVPGNHDQGGSNYSKYTSIDDVPEEYRKYYGNGLFTEMTGSERFYSFDQEDYHYIVLDPDEAKSSVGVGFVELSEEQKTWLRSDLQANAAKNIILFFHQPSSDWSNWSDVAGILQGYNIKMIFNGHWHVNSPVDNGFAEQSSGALCGSWWRYDVNKDGSPYGYRLVCPMADGVHSFYKNLDSDQQINLISPVDVAISGQVSLEAQAYAGSQVITAMKYRIDTGEWQNMSMQKVAVWYEGEADAAITADGQYHQIEVACTAADGSQFSSAKLFKFDADPVIDINTIKEHFVDFQGRYATVAATVTSSMVSGYMPILEDQSGAMSVWAGECIGLPAFVVGNGVKLRGQVATDGYDVKQLQVHDAGDITGDTAAIYNPKVLAIPEVADACYELVKIQRVTITEILDASDFYVQDEDNNRLLIYTGETSDFDCTASLHVGDVLDITGIAWLYNGEAEICTRFSTDMVEPQLTSAVKIAVFSDPHYYAPELGASGTAFEQYLASDRKLIAESQAILESTVNAIKNSDAQIVLVCGDLTKDGELVNHQQFAGYLQQLKNAGKKVYVIDGNHDINNPHAYSYNGDIATPVTYTTPSDFKNIYSAFGYGEAVAVDSNSLSYAVDPVPGLRIIAMDAALYDTNIADKESKTAGAFSTDRLNWIKNQIAGGAAQGKTVIGMMHHGLTNHFSLQSQLFPEYVIQNAGQVAAELSSAGMKVVFTGHFHAQDIVQIQTGDGFIFDVETGSLVTYPVPYRLVELSPDGQLKIDSEKITSINYNTGGETFQDYAEDYLVQGLNGLVPAMLAGIILQMQPGLSNEQAMAAANNAAAQQLTPALTVKDSLVNAMVAHYHGDEDFDSQLLAIYQGMAGSTDALTRTLGGALLSLCQDLTPADNDVMLDLMSGYTEDPPVFNLIPVADTAYEIGSTADGIKTMTVKSGISGFKYFEDSVIPVSTHNGAETVVFVHFRNGVQMAINAARADFDTVPSAKTGFSVLPGDVVKSYIVDDLTNEINRNPILYQ